MAETADNLVATYIYVDDDGREVARKRRYESLEGKRFEWWRNGSLGLSGLAQSELPLYGYHAWQAQAADAGHWLVVEGEKAQEAAELLKIPAVGTCGAATTPADEQLRKLLQHAVYLFPDHDEPGRKHMRAVGERLVALGATDVRVVQWPDAGPGDDIADFYERYGDTEEELAAALHDLFLSPAPFAEWVAEQWPGEEHGNGCGSGEPRPILRRRFTAADVLRELGEVKWLWPDWVPVGGVTLLAAEPNSGKSMFALHLVRVLWEGPAWPDGTPHEGDPEAGVVWVEADNNHQAVAERMKRWGLDPDRLAMPSSYDHPDFTRDEHLQLLAEEIAREQARLVVVDALAGIHSLDENSVEMKRLIDRLGDLAREHNAALVCCHHYRKRSTEGGANRAMDRARGSSAIMGAVKYGLALEETRSGLLLTRFKATHGAKSDLTLRMKIADEGVSFEVEEGADPGRRQFEWERAAELLREVLGEGKRAASEVMTEAALIGINRGAVDRAAAKLQVVKRSDGGVHTWELPGQGDGKNMKL